MCKLRIILLLAFLIPFQHAKTMENKDNSFNDEDDVPKLAWLEKYMLYAEIINLSTGIFQNVQFWKSKHNLKMISNGIITQIKRGNILYTIEPQADKHMHSEDHCVWLNLSISNENNLETLLPAPTLFDRKVKDVINGMEVYKFINNSFSDEGIEVIWAKYNSLNKMWIPVRYERLIYNMWLGALWEHTVIHYFGLYPEFNDSVFFSDQVNTKCKYQLSKDYYKHLQSLEHLNPHNPRHVDLAFDEFKVKYEKVYSDQNEHSMRRKIFQETMKRVLATNKQNLGYTLGINVFADMTQQEKAKYLGLVGSAEYNRETIPFPYTSLELEDIADSLPKQYDLRLLGLVTPVKNQGICGSCWSFGTTTAAEGALARSNGGRLLRLSEQALMDCAWPYGAKGCDGGLAIEAYEFMMEYGIPTNKEYGIYTSQDGNCHIESMEELYKIRGFTFVPAYSDTAIKVAIINHGPLAVSFQVTDNFQQYTGGIYYDQHCNDSYTNHVMTLVGYGEQDGAGFWIVQNSWGPDWGIAGYVFISMDKPCGITAEPTYVVF